MKQSWRTIILSRGKQGAKAMREFYRDLHKAHPDLEEKVRCGEKGTHTHTQARVDACMVPCVYVCECGGVGVGVATGLW